MNIYLGKDLVVNILRNNDHSFDEIMQYANNQGKILFDKNYSQSRVYLIDREAELRNEQFQILCK